MTMNSTRNYLMTMNLRLSLVSMSFAAAAVATGLFGMYKTTIR